MSVSHPAAPHDGADVLAAPDAPIEDRVFSTPVMCLIAVLIGLVAAAGAAIFHHLINVVHNLFFYGVLSTHYNANEFEAPSAWGAGIILSPVIGGLIVVWIVRTFAPEAKGHGVPEVMFAIYHKKGNIRGAVAVAKTLASAISIGSGASVGREGPIIQIGASFGSTIARFLNVSRWQKITLLSAGAGAGIAATFNTPLGGVLFAVEMLLPEVSNRTFLPVVVATATATYVSHMVFGLDPAFLMPLADVTISEAVDPVQLVSYGVLGALAGVMSWAFIKTLAKCEDLFPALGINDYLQNVIGMLMVGLLAYGFFVVTGHYHTSGVGYATIQDILNGSPYTLALLACLLFGKVFATSVSLGAGASGGVFSPSLFIGATLGGLVGVAGSLIFPEHGFQPAEFAMVGMAAVVGGATGAAMTAIVMLFEMTRDYNVIVPLVLAVALAVGVRRALIQENIYTIKLRNRGKVVPTNRHTNMYLVQQARELMATNVKILPIDMAVEEALHVVANEGIDHVIAADGARIAGYVRFGTVPYAPDRYAGQTLKDLLRTDYVVSPKFSILNTIISRMNQRGRSFAIITDTAARVPRLDDVVGVIDRTEIADAVIANHYD